MIRKIFRKIKLRQVNKNFLSKVSADKKELNILINARSVNTGPKENIVIGKHCTVDCVLRALFGGKIVIGDNNFISYHTELQSAELIKIGNNVIISNNVLITDNNNHPTDPKMRLNMSKADNYLNSELWSWQYADKKPVIIEDNVWIGRDARILKGVTIGEGSIVALGAVVTHDVPKYSVVAGNPARVVKTLESLEKE